MKKIKHKIVKKLDFGCRVEVAEVDEYDITLTVYSPDNDYVSVLMEKADIISITTELLKWINQ